MPASPIAQLPAVLLADGLATRVRPISENVPKLLIEVVSEPFFLQKIRRRKKDGLIRIVMCVGYLGEKIVELFGKGYNGVSISDTRSKSPNSSAPATRSFRPCLNWELLLRSLR